MATLERWHLVRGRNKDMGTSSGKDLWPYYRGWPLLRVATKRGTTVLSVLTSVVSALEETLLDPALLVFCDLAVNISASFFLCSSLSFARS